MRNQLSSRGFRVVLSLFAVFVLVGVFLKFSESASSEPKEPSTSVSDPNTATKALAGTQSAGPIEMRAVGFAESIAVRDMPEVKVDRKGKKIDVRELDEIREKRQEKLYGQVENSEDVPEINKFNREVVKQPDLSKPGTVDGALSASKGKKSRSFLPPNPPSVNFEGQSIADTIAVGQGFLPPDTNGDVGPNHYVQTVNVTFRIWDKAGNPLTPVASLNTLFGPLGGSCGPSEDGDPIVLYDQLADRWLISQFCTVADPNNHQLIAISKTGDPTGSYYLYNFMMPNNKFNDYPHFGMWPDAYYMTDNQFNQAGTAFLGGGMFAFNRAKMLVGDPTANFVYFDSCPTSTGCDIGGELPADMDGYTPPAAGTPGIFAFFRDDQQGDPADDIRLFDFHVDFTTPANSTFTERTGSPLPVAAFDSRVVPNSRNVVPQPAPAAASSFLDAIGDRLMFRLAYRNFGTSESLVMNHTVNAAVNPLYRAGVRYYQLNRATPASAFTIGEQQTFAPADTTNRWMGSGAMNWQGDTAVGFSASSSTVFPSVRYAARLSTDAAGTGLAQGEQNIVAGAGSQTSTSGRWGDYSDLAVDPSDDCTFWYTQEYYPVSSEPGNTTAPWHTRIAKFAPGPCAASPRGTISGTITSCQTGLPVPNAFVSITGGYSRATLANGTYSAIVPPGTYNATATGFGYDTISLNGLVVANGGNATFSGCLTGNLKLPVADTGTVTSDSCNSNNTIDPNENVTVSLGIKNSGTLNTVNLVGTLQATGGVTSPGPAQTYGVVVAGGATVFKSFTFTAGNVACGSTVVATLQLQDGATDLGTVSYNFQTGTLAVNTYSTGDIAVAIPDNVPAGIDIPINIPDNISISDVNVSIRTNHTFDGDLAFSLVHPDNTTVPLITNRGSSGANFGTGTNSCAGTPTTLDDGAATAISAGTAPFAGSFRPESVLSALNGKPSNGTWKLHVADTAGQDVGTVGCVKIEINKRFVCCGALINAAPPPVITAENAIPANNAADPGETVTVQLPIVNVGGNDTTNLVGTLQATGGVTNPSGPQTYGVVVSGGPAVQRPFTFTVSPQTPCGGTITLTLALQDGATNLGTVTYTMQTGTTVVGAPVTFSNSTAVVIPATGTGATTGAPATPYPSNIAVAGLTGTVSKVTVTLSQISHTFPSDVDVLLVGPNGAKFILMSDVIGGTDWTGQTYTFDDAAAAVLPASGAPPATGSFRPTNYGTGDVFPAPAPAAPYLTPATAGSETLASAFGGINPNGTWSLYVVDDAGTDIGTFAGGWSLSVTTAAPVCATAPTLHSDLSITKTDNTSAVTAGGTTTYTIVASNAGPDAAIGATVVDNFPATITSVNWTCIASAGSSCPANGTGNINASVNLLVGGTATFTAIAQISPAATFGMSNTATVTPPAGTSDPNPNNSSARDVDNICSGTTFSYSGAVVPIPDAADLSGTSPGAPANATLNVAGVPGPIADINLSIDGTACSTTAGSTTVGLDHTFVSDLHITLLSPSGTPVLVINEADSSGNNFCQVILDDQTANPSIQTVTSAQAPFAGTWKPNAPLSAFNGQNPNGTWTLRAQDFFSGDTGNIRAWSLNITACPTTAAGVSVSGRVTTPDGRGLRNARVVITDSLGNARTVTTSSFGTYQFDDVAVGDNYVIGVVSKQYRFSSQLIQVGDTLTDINFVGQD